MTNTEDFIAGDVARIKSDAWFYSELPQQMATKAWLVLSVVDIGAYMSIGQTVDLVDPETLEQLPFQKYITSRVSNGHCSCIFLTKDIFLSAASHAKRRERGEE